MTPVLRASAVLFEATCPVCHIHARSTVRAALVRWWNDHRVEHGRAA